MATWPGWEAQLAKALHVADTKYVNYLFKIWAAETKSGCNGNPVVTSQHATGSSNCKLLPNGKHAQNYKSNADGIQATVKQLESGDYPALLAAIKSGNPYNVSDPQAVADDLKKWGAPGAGLGYMIEVNEGSFGSGIPAPGTPVGNDAQTLKGWNDVQRSVNHYLPAALHTSRRSRVSALRELRRASKVLK